MDVYFEARTVERAKSCPSSVVTMIVSGAEVLRGLGDAISTKVFGASTDIAITKDLVAFIQTQPNAALQLLATTQA
jgi:hypothetical protein